MAREGKDDIITWLPHGKAFRILKPKELAEEILPEYFNRIQYKSFIRQLNIYGFKRVDDKKSPDRGAYRHSMFERGKEHQFPHMTRKISSSKGERASKKAKSESSEAVEMSKSIDENLSFLPEGIQDPIEPSYVTSALFDDDDDDDIDKIQQPQLLEDTKNAIYSAAKDPSSIDSSSSSTTGNLVVSHDSNLSMMLRGFQVPIDPNHMPDIFDGSDKTQTHSAELTAYSQNFLSSLTPIGFSNPTQMPVQQHSNGGTPSAPASKGQPTLPFETLFLNSFQHR